MTRGLIFALAAQAVKSLFAVDWLHATASDLIVAAIQHLSHLDKLCEVPGHSFLKELIRSAAGRRGELLKA